MNTAREAQLQQAVDAGQLLPQSLTNIQLLLRGTQAPEAPAAIDELIAQKAWDELNNRFFKTLAFGTGGLRGRTIGSIVTEAEQGAGGVNDRPEFPCVGTASMNYFNVGRAMRGLIIYVRRFVDAQQGRTKKPFVIIGHDTRHFSRDFAEYCARLTTELGCDCALFDGPCSTPEVSFAIRELNADAGVVLTASHNPSHDNGFKAYFNEGAQLVPPHDKGVIDEVNALESDSYDAVPADQQGELRVLDASFDKIYTDRLKGIILRPDVFAGSSAKVVFTNLHGTGGRCIVPLLREIGSQVSTVAEQDSLDGRFPTVVSPNPENPPALSMAMAQADVEQADLVIATDPDADRMGVAVRNQAGEMELLTGNQIGSLMSWYRCMSMIELGIINESNIKNAVQVKTFVTSPLQDAIAEHYGIATVNVLTGFKYIADKLGNYEAAIPADKRDGYRLMDEATTRSLRLQYSKYFVFGGEESYGYLAQDFVRDKDANAAALILAELNAYLATQGKSLLECLYEIYAQYGVYREQGKNLVMEGADGAAKIAALTQSYIQNPPAEMDGSAVAAVRNFSTGTEVDVEDLPIPAENMLIMQLADGRSFAVRPSGTEPKIKFYLFGHGVPTADVDASILAVDARLASLWDAIQADVKARS